MSGKSAVVLGASSPYGRAVVRMLARKGVNLVLGGRSRQNLEMLEEEIRSSDGEALVVGTHLAKRHHSVHLVEAAVEAFGGVDVLLFMACASAPAFGAPNLDAWDRSIDVNFKGFLYVLAAVLPAMQEGGGGHVVSLHLEDPQAGDPLYEASRAAARVVLQGLGRELSGAGVHASEVRLEGPRRVSPERCAESMCRLLADAPDAAEGFRVWRLPGV